MNPNTILNWCNEICPVYFQGFISKKQYNKSTPVTRVIDGGEPVDFKCLFKDWPQPTPPGKVYTNSRIGKLVVTIATLVRIIRRNIILELF